MLLELLDKQKRHLDYFYAHLDREAFARLIAVVKECKGTLFFTGVGKSGFVAQKIAASMLSTGTRALFLSPLDALHGDLGLVTAQDYVCLFSKSGHSRELLELLPLLHRRGAITLALCSTPNSPLVKESTHSLILPCAGELCPFGLAPTTSAEIQLLFGDVLTVALMQQRQFTLDQYAANHPSGQIGQRATLKVKDVMLSDAQIPLCTPEDRLQDVLMEFTEKRCGCLLVVNAEKQLQGIFTDGDLRRALQLKGDQLLQQKLGELMTKGVSSIHPDMPAWEAIHLMEEDRARPISVLPVLTSGQVTGLLKLHDLIHAGL